MRPESTPESGSSRPANPPARKPEWLKVRGFGGQRFNDVSSLLQDLSLSTVCQEANCPNRGECFNRGTAVFLILGSFCTRGCTFCNVRSGRPTALDPDEPARVAEASRRMNLRHVVITSVTRDDLDDGGAGQFAECIVRIREKLPKATIEVLTPDFLGSESALKTVLAAQPDVFNHNVETVPRLYREVRPGADYRRSLAMLASAHDLGHPLIKSGLMVGLGETVEELNEVFHDLARSHVSLLTIGQYLAPSPDHYPIARFVPPDEFDRFRTMANDAGIATVFSGPLVRSSYLADTFLPAR